MSTTTKTLDLDALGRRLRDLCHGDGYPYLGHGEGCPYPDYSIRPDGQSMAFWPDMESDEKYEFFVNGSWLNSTKKNHPEDVWIFDAWRAGLVAAGIVPPPPKPPKRENTPLPFDPADLDGELPDGRPWPNPEHATERDDAGS